MGEISRIGVVGCGTMGSGIAEVCARSGLDVLVGVSADDSLTAGRKRLWRSLDAALRKGRLTEPERDAARDRVSFTTDLGDLADRHLVVEAIREHEPDKFRIFTALDRIVDAPDAILASNTSSIPIIPL